MGMGMRMVVGLGVGLGSDVANTYGFRGCEKFAPFFPVGDSLLMNVGGFVYIYIYIYTYLIYLEYVQNVHGFAQLPPVVLSYHAMKASPLPLMKWKLENAEFFENTLNSKKPM